MFYRKKKTLGRPKKKDEDNIYQQEELSAATTHKIKGIKSRENQWSQTSS